MARAQTPTATTSGSGKPTASGIVTVGVIDLTRVVGPGVLSSVYLAKAHKGDNNSHARTKGWCTSFSIDVGI